MSRVRRKEAINSFLHTITRMVTCTLPIPMVAILSLHYLDLAEVASFTANWVCSSSSSNPLDHSARMDSSVETIRLYTFLPLRCVWSDLSKCVCVCL